jgi:Bacterial TniB protein
MKNGTLTHLLPAARKQAELGNDERILGLLRDRWIDYPRATQALQQLERLYQTPRRDRMPCLLLHGDSNIGKTKITAKFRREHPNEFDDRSGERCSVVSMQMPPTPDQHRFYSGLLFELGAPHNAAAGLASLERLARDILRRVSPRMLVVDEVHHLLVGTRDAVLALQTDTQMMSRYTPFEIPRWRESDGLRRLLAAFERVLPLRKPSDLARREIVQFVLSASGGLTGEISTLLNNAAELAIRNGDELIDMTHLEHVCRITQ